MECETKESAILLDGTAYDEVAKKTIEVLVDKGASPMAMLLMTLAFVELKNQLFKEEED